MSRLRQLFGCRAVGIPPAMFRDRLWFTLESIRAAKRTRPGR